MKRFLNIKSLIKSEDGVSGIEFALVGPFLMLLLVGALDFGLYMTEKMQVHSATYTAAEYISNVQDDTNVQTVAIESYVGRSDNIVFASEFTCECSDGIVAACPLDCGEDDYSRRFTTVSASAVFNPLFPYPVIGQSLNMQSNVRMRVD